MKRDSTIIAITSGKGGVGKSVVAVNLAETLAGMGHRVALVDADLGQGACALLMNETPPASVMDVIRHTARTPQVLHRTTAGVTLVQTAAEAGEADGRERALYAALDELLAHLRRTHHFVVVDTPAGTDGPVRWALDRADLGVVVVVGEPTAISDAYRLAKLVWQADPAYPLATVVNFADSADEAQSVADRFATITEHFTGQVPNYLGWVPFSAQVRHSVSAQEPVVRTPGALQNAFESLSATLVRGRQPVLQAVAS